MLHRRRLLATLLAAFLPLPVWTARAAARPGPRLVDGWILTEADLAAIARLDR